MPIAVGAANFRWLSPCLKSIWLYCVLGLLLDGAASVLWWSSIPNLLIGHLNTILEFALLANAFRCVATSVRQRNTITVLMVFFAAVALGNTLWLQATDQFNTYSKVLECLLLVGMALSYFSGLARELRIQRLERDPFFWVSCAVLIYFASSFFIFAYSNFMLYYSQQLGIQFWFIHALFLVLFYAILSIALWIAPKSSTLPR